VQLFIQMAWTIARKRIKHRLEKTGDFGSSDTREARLMAEVNLQDLVN
jgi:hypothetical protein